MPSPSEHAAPVRKKRGPVHVARSGNVRVSVYRYANGRCCVAWTPGRGLKQKRETFPTLEEAKTRAGKVAEAIETGRATVLELTGARIDGYLQAMQMLEPLGVSLPVAIEEYVAAKKALGDLPLLDAIQTHLGTLKRPRKVPSGVEVLAALVASISEIAPKTAGEYRYRQGIRNDLKRYVAALPRLETTTAKEIRDYLIALNVGPRRRDNIRDEIVQLHRFARTKDGGEIFATNANLEAELVKRLNVPTPITTYSPAELVMLLKFVSPRWLPWLAIAAFSGLRPTEILRLDWSAFKWTENPEPIIAIPKWVARKTKSPRRAELGPTLRRWLAPYRDAVGALYLPAAGYAEESKLLRELTKEQTRLGKVMSEVTGSPWRWKPDAARHSYGSYRYAQVKDFGLVAAWMGDLVQTVKDRYFDSKSEEDGHAWFGVLPEHATNVIQARFHLG